MSGERLGVSFKTLGCKVNQVESEDIAADLLGRGVALVDESDAAVVVVNTCTVTGEADAKARKAVRHALASPSRPVVVVTGCMAALSRAQLEAISERVVVEADKALVPERVARALEDRGEVLSADSMPATPRARWGRTSIPARCSRSKTAAMPSAPTASCRTLVEVRLRCPSPESRQEAVALVDAGVREIVLTGVNLGRYDDNGLDLSDVVLRVAASGVERLRISSIEPPDLTDRFLETLASTPAACPHLHVPLQSGSDAVLSRMARRYSVAEYEAAIERARGLLPGLAVTTDVIAGFPGETESDHTATLDACRRIGFAKLHVFRYSEREGTPAAAMPAAVPPEVRAERAAELRELDSELQSAFRRAHQGREVEVLVERVASSGTAGAVATGTAADYLKVALALDWEPTVGEISSATVIDADVAPVKAVAERPR